jgi:hypothetical protein
VLFSCSQRETQQDKPAIDSLKASLKSVVNTPPYGLMFDTLYFDDNIIKIDTVRYLTTPPKITRLPFGFDYDKNGFAYYDETDPPKRAS